MFLATVQHGATNRDSNQKGPSDKTTSYTSTLSKDFQFDNERHLWNKYEDLVQGKLREVGLTEYLKAIPVINKALYVGDNGPRYRDEKAQKIKKKTEIAFGIIEQTIKPSDMAYALIESTRRTNDVVRLWKILTDYYNSKNQAGYFEHALKLFDKFSPDTPLVPFSRISGEESGSSSSSSNNTTTTTQQQQQQQEKRRKS